MNETKAKTIDTRAAFAEYLTRTHRRHTPERVIVLQAVESLKGHFGVEEVLQALEQGAEHIATGTVYNTLQLLVEAGLLARHIFGGRTLYESAPASHSHTVCTICGKIRDVRFPVLEQQARTLRIPRFAAASVAVNIYGVCAACARKAKAKTGPKKKTQTNHTHR